MKRKVLLSIVILTLSVRPSLHIAQIGRDYWSYGLVKQTGNLLFLGLCVILTSIVSGAGFHLADCALLFPMDF